MLADRTTDAELVARVLKAAGVDCDITCAESVSECRNRLLVSPPNLVLADCLLLPGVKGGPAFDVGQARYSDVPLIVVTGASGDGASVEALCGGASGSVQNDRLEGLPAAVLRALRRAGQQEAGDAAERNLCESQIRYRGLCDVSNVGIVVIEAESGMIREENPSICNAWGGRGRNLSAIGPRGLISSKAQRGTGRALARTHDSPRERST